MKQLKRILILLLLMVLAGCGAAPTLAPTAVVPTEAVLVATSLPTEIPTNVPTAMPTSVLTLDMLKNMAWIVPTYSQQVTLVDGNFEGQAGSETLRVQLLPQVAFGDLDGDGRADAAVLLAENGGGTGNFVSLVAVMDFQGEAIQSSSVLVDDRPRINSIAIVDGVIVLDTFIHGPEDAMAGPSLPVVESYRLTPNGLVLVNYFTRINDTEHSIRIDSPASGSEVSGALQVKGSMPEGPFENNLVYQITDADNNVYAKGPFPVQSDGMGAPARFDNNIPLPSIPAGTVIRFDLSELSMKDGSLVAMDLVLLTVK